MISTELDLLIKQFSRLPGLGARSARRIVLHLLKQKETTFLPFIENLQQVHDQTVRCSHCGNIDTHDPCLICQDARRDPHTLIVIEDVSDLWALERAKVLHAHYHVLGGHLSPLQGIGPDQLHIASLIKRVEQHQIKEVILALNATIEGQTTAHYITDKLNSLPVKVTKLAQGMPIGGELTYLDDNTLIAALQARIVI